MTQSCVLNELLDAKVINRYQYFQYKENIVMGSICCWLEYPQCVVLQQSTVFQCLWLTNKAVTSSYIKYFQILKTTFPTEHCFVVSAFRNSSSACFSEVSTLRSWCQCLDKQLPQRRLQHSYKMMLMCLVHFYLWKTGSLYYGCSLVWVHLHCERYSRKWLTLKVGVNWRRRNCFWKAFNIAGWLCLTL